LFRAVKDEPGSITAIAQRLRRDRSAVKRDLDALQAAGMVIVDEKILPGHGRLREVRATALHLRLQADVS
jgi:predicted transcriptional regulator